MRAILNTALRRKKLDQLYELISGKRTMKAVNYPPREFDDIHLSDLDWDGSCAMIPYLSRTVDKEVKYTDLSILRFLRGRIVERTIADELEPIIKDDIICTLDDFVDGFGYNEIKSTVKDCDPFNPITTFPHWINRIKGYIKAGGLARFNLTVLFWVGNVWTSRRRGTPFIPVELKAWTLLPDTDKEINDHWKECVRRRTILRTALDSGDPTELIEATNKYKPKWFSHDACEFREICPLGEKNNVEKEKV